VPPDQQEASQIQRPAVQLAGQPGREVCEVHPRRMKCGFLSLRQLMRVRLWSQIVEPGHDGGSLAGNDSQPCSSIASRGRVASVAGTILGG
jgi:hypothetical protein